MTCSPRFSRAAMGAAGHRRYESLFTARAAVERYAACYRELVGRHGRFGGAEDAA